MKIWEHRATWRKGLTACHKLIPKKSWRFWNLCANNVNTQNCFQYKWVSTKCSKMTPSTKPKLAVADQIINYNNGRCSHWNFELPREIVQDCAALFCRTRSRKCCLSLQAINKHWVGGINREPVEKSITAQINCRVKVKDVPIADCPVISRTTIMWQNCKGGGERGFTCAWWTLLPPPWIRHCPVM